MNLSDVSKTLLLGELCLRFLIKVLVIIQFEKNENFYDIL